MDTQDEIKKFLQTHPYSCADELSAVLGKTRANIQHHLKILEQDKYLARVSIVPAVTVRGRPRVYYSLAPLIRDNNFLPLLEAFFNVLIHEVGEEPKDRLLRKISRQILDPGEGATSLTHRLTRTVKHLSKSGYQARWEAHAEGPQVLFRNCPYHPLPDKFPEMCRMDALLLLQNLDVPEVEQIAQIHIPSTPACCFRIKTN